MNWRSGLARGWLVVSGLWIVACGLEWRAARDCAADHRRAMMISLARAEIDMLAARAMSEQSAVFACEGRQAQSIEWAWLGPILLAYACAAGVWTVRGFRRQRPAADAPSAP